MGNVTGIAWTDHTYNPWQGCHKVSQGCKNCYMYAEKARYGQDPTTVIRSKDATFYAPLKWQKQAAAAGEQRKVFTCSWSDFFIEEADAWRDEALAIMALTPHLTYQVLTKRPGRMLDYFTRFSCDTREVWKNYLSDVAYKHFGENAECAVANAIEGCLHAGYNIGWPMQNLWLGVSVEDQATADARIPLLLQTPTAMRFVSYEPALGPVNFDPFLGSLPADDDGAPYPGSLDWIIVGGESGPGARPLNLSWARQTLEQCRAAGVACFVKQLGEAWWKEDIKHRPAGLWRNRHGAEMAQWPEALRVQEFPPERATEEVAP